MALVPSELEAYGKLLIAAPYQKLVPLGVPAHVPVFPPPLESRTLVELDGVHEDVEAVSPHIFHCATGAGNAGPKAPPVTEGPGFCPRRKSKIGSSRCFTRRLPH